MRLLLIANDFPNPFDRNKGVFNLNLAKALLPEHEIRVICPVPWVDELRGRRRAAAFLNSQRQANLAGVEVHYPRYYYPPKLCRGSYGWFYWHSIRRTVEKLFAEYAPQAVVGYWAHPDGEAAVRAARLAKVPSAVIVGGSDVLLAARHPRRRRRIANVLAAADAVITVSEHLKTNVIDLGIASEKIHVWRQGVDAERFRPGDRGDARCRINLPATRQVLLWVGRLVPVKAVEVLLQACAILRTRGSDFRLYLVGDGLLRKPLEAQAASLGLSDIVCFVGETPYEQLPDWYRAADLVVLPSWSEGLPNVLREAVACGTPFVASRVGGIAEIARTACDRLVPPGDPLALADEIAAALARHNVHLPHDSTIPDWKQSACALVDILRPLVSEPSAQTSAVSTVS